MICAALFAPESIIWFAVSVLTALAGMEFSVLYCNKVEIGKARDLALFARLAGYLLGWAVVACLVVLAFVPSCYGDATCGPFRLGSGHFASLAFHIGTYFTEGSFYYLDSFPRNLPEESALNRKDKLENTYSLYVHPNEKLRKTHTVERINREVLCLRLNQDLLEQVQSSLAWQTMKPRLEYYFSKFQFYGNCMVIVSLPATAESGNS